jgi:ABC-type enterochelin transport system substrate-binding protein
VRARPTLEQLRDAERKAARRKALRALKKAEKIAAETGVELSAWEGEFLGSVAERVKTYGRAFGDPEKGAPGESLSALQRRKLKEITAKAKGEAPTPRFGRRPPTRHSE